MVVPLMDNRHLPQDEIHKIAHVWHIGVTQVFEHLSFFRQAVGISMIEVAADKSKDRVNRGSAGKGLAWSSQSSDRGEIRERQKGEVSRASDGRERPK